MALFEEGSSGGLRPRGSFNVKVKYEGNWVAYNDLIRSTDIVLAMAAREGQKRFAESYKKAVQKNISEGGRRFGYPSNEGEYLQRKITYGGGSIPLRFSDTMKDSVVVMHNSTQTRFMVGIPEGLSRPTYYPSDSNELEVHEYANIVERGYETSKVIVPPRPVFSDTFRKTMKGVAGIRASIESMIIMRFARKGVKVTKRLGNV